MGESAPLYSTKAHVFHIDPMTKKSWIPASSGAVPVSFFYDSSRALYRIISVEGTKAVINSTVTPSMSFTKTSQKFGQWSDVRANTVYGLGFLSEQELNQFIEKFQEVKESTRAKSSGGGPTPIVKDFEGKDQDGSDANANVAKNLQNHHHLQPNQPQTHHHQRSQSLSAAAESPSKKIANNVPDAQHQNEGQLRLENERLRLALAQSSSNASRWEVELATLKSNNSRLTSALQESTQNVEEWKRQLAMYKEENSRLKMKVQGQDKNGGAGDFHKDEDENDLGMVEQLRAEIEKLKTELKEKQSVIDGLGDTTRITGNGKALPPDLERLNRQLEEKVSDIVHIQREIANTLKLNH